MSNVDEKQHKPKVQLVAAIAIIRFEEHYDDKPGKQEYFDHNRMYLKAVNDQYSQPKERREMGKIAFQK